MRLNGGTCATFFTQILDTMGGKVGLSKVLALWRKDGQKTLLHHTKFPEVCKKTAFSIQGAELSALLEQRGPLGVYPHSLQVQSVGVNAGGFVGAIWKC